MIKKKNGFLICSGLILVSLTAVAQENTIDPIDTLAKNVQNINDELHKIKRLKITGYIQPQWEYPPCHRLMESHLIGQSSHKGKQNKWK